MSEELFDKDGNIVENAMSPEDVETKLEEEREKTRQEVEEEANKQLEEYKKSTDEEMEELQKQLDGKEEELTKEKDKEKNFGALRGKNKEDKEKIDSLEQEIKDIKTSIEETKTKVSDEAIDMAIGKLAGDDKELAEKVKFYYKTFSGEPKDKEEFLKRIENSYVLATGGKPTNPITGEVISSAGGSLPPTVNPSGEKLSEKGKEAAKDMGISDQELAKHKLV